MGGQKAGIFISLEGGEGSGKTTQIAGLKSRLEAEGVQVVLTREPGGSRGAEEIRKLLVEGDPGRWTPMSEVLLNYAARLDHVEKVIKPALGDGNWVITDRFSDSTLAYQGYAQGLGAEIIKDIHDHVLGDFLPDLTLILDVPVDVGLGRAGVRLDADGSKEDRFERMGGDFHDAIRQAFIEIAKAAPTRCRLIDASGDADTTEAMIWNEIIGRFGEFDD
jgi:dTMP kinase